MQDRTPRLDHEKLEVYKCALEFARISYGALAKIPAGEKEMREQWKRAALSIPLNIAEGTGKPGSPDRARFHATARGSAMECSALVDVAEIAGYVGSEQAECLKVLLIRIVAMLSKMCR